MGGPSRVASLTSHKWFVSFNDCYGRTTCLFLMNAKSKITFCFKTFHKVVIRYLTLKIRVLQISDNCKVIT